MRILLATPLYPPDIKEPAPYVKEIATRLNKHHTMHVIAYGHLPEQVPGVTFTMIKKTEIPLVRLLRFTTTLFREARRANLIYAQNGISVEVPLLILSVFTRTPILFRIGDNVPLRYAETRWFHRAILSLLKKRVTTIVSPQCSSCDTDSIVTDPLPRPEILPFGPYPQEKFDTYEHSWSTHISELNHYLNV